MTTQQKLITADEFLLLEERDRLYELVDGVMREKAMAGQQRGRIKAKIIGELGNHTRENRQGWVVSSVGYILQRNPDTVRLADVSWVSTRRDSPEAIPGFPEGAPDLAIEVKSPTNTYAEMARRGEMWLEYGCRMAWIAYPERQTIAVHRPGQAPETLGVDDTLDGGALLPGFSIPVRRIFGLPQ